MAGFPRLRDERYDLAIVGGGHAGLQAALKAALLRYSVVLIDRGPKYSRSYYAPRMHNIPGFPDGISGHKLLDAQIAAVKAAHEFVTYVTPAIADAARRTTDGFEVDFNWLARRHTVRSRALFLGTGVVDRMPEIDGKIDVVWPWANLGLLGFCDICDGHEMTGKTVAVLGHDSYAVRLALELRHFAPTSVELVTMGRPLFDGVEPSERGSLSAALAEAKIAVVETGVAGIEGLRERAFHVRFADGSVRPYDRGFSGLGWYDMHTALPLSLGASLAPDGYVRTDEDGRAIDASGVPIPGLYVIGDLRSGWNQIPEAWATAERSVLDLYAEYFEL